MSEKLQRSGLTRKEQGEPVKFATHKNPFGININKEMQNYFILNLQMKDLDYPHFPRRSCQ